MLLRRKLFLAFGSLGLLTGTAGLVAVAIDSRIKSDFTQIGHCAIEKPRAAAEMSETLQTYRLRMQEFLADRQSVAPSAQREATTTALKQASEQFEASLATSHKVTLTGLQLVTAEGNLEDIRTSKQEVALLDEIEARFASLKEYLEKVLFRSTANQEEVRVLPSSLLDDDEQIARLVKDYRTGTEDQLSLEIQEVDDALGQASKTILWSALFTLAVGGFLAWLFSRALTRPLSLLTNAARRIGQGHLDTTVNVGGRDELGLLAETFNRMAGDLRSTTVSRDYVDSIIKSMPNTLIVVQPDGLIKSVNEATLKLLGYTENELIGQPMECILNGRVNGTPSPLDEVAERGFVSDAAVSYRNRNGIAVPMTFSASIVHDGDNASTGVVCVAEDISERKKTEHQLENVQKELLLASRQAGMAEVATNVLHNVGNVLNSINVSSTLVSDKMRKSKAASLSKVVSLLDEHATDLGSFLTSDPKGKQLPGYLRQLDEHVTQERENVVSEMDSLRKNVDHIKDIVAMQQNYAKIFGVAETVNVIDLVEDALRMNAGALVRHDVDMVRDFQEVPLVTLEKHKVLQVLVNLIRNAKYACDDSGRVDKLITMRVTESDGAIEVSVIDNGIGIPPENLTRIFNHGFTTRKEGHGFGLHSGALAAMELGGSLTVHSDGLGQGATFTLCLPLSPGDDSHE